MKRTPKTEKQFAHHEIGCRAQWCGGCECYDIRKAWHGDGLKRVPADSIRFTVRAPLEKLPAYLLRIQGGAGRLAAVSSPSEAIVSRLRAAMSHPVLDNLYARWQDESEYEDIKEYGEAFAKATGLKVLRCTKRPFGFVVGFDEMPGTGFHIKCRARKTVCERVHLPCVTASFA